MNAGSSDLLRLASIDDKDSCTTTVSELMGPYVQVTGSYTFYGQGKAAYNSANRVATPSFLLAVS